VVEHDEDAIRVAWPLFVDIWPGKPASMAAKSSPVENTTRHYGLPRIIYRAIFELGKRKMEIPAIAEHQAKDQTIPKLIGATGKQT